MEERNWDTAVLPTSDSDGRPSPYTGHNLVFIVGSPRSGTTWLQRLLACHPMIRTGQESHVFSINIGPQLRDWRRLAAAENRGGVGLACYFTEEEFMAVLREYMLKLLSPMIAPLRDGQLFLEKTPGHADYVREIVELLPESRIIHLVRDLRDVVASSKAASQSWGRSWAPGSMKDAVTMWRASVTAVQEAKKYLGPAQLLELRYEDLLKQPLPGLRACAKFLRLAWDDAAMRQAIEVNEATRARKSGGGAPIPLGGLVAQRVGTQVVEPVDFIRKAASGTWKEDLTSLEKFTVWRLGRHSMEEAGYPWRTPWQTCWRALQRLRQSYAGR